MAATGAEALPLTCPNCGAGLSAQLCLHCGELAVESPAEQAAAVRAEPRRAASVSPGQSALGSLAFLAGAAQFAICLGYLVSRPQLEGLEGTLWYSLANAGARMQLLLDAREPAQFAAVVAILAPWAMPLVAVRLTLSFLLAAIGLFLRAGSGAAVARAWALAALCVIGTEAVVWVLACRGFRAEGFSYAMRFAVLCASARALLYAPLPLLLLVAVRTSKPDGYQE